MYNSSSCQHYRVHLRRSSDSGPEKVGLVGTRFTMEADFFKRPFTEAGVQVVVPHADEIDYIAEKSTMNSKEALLSHRRETRLPRSLSECIRMKALRPLFWDAQSFLFYSRVQSYLLKHWTRLIFILRRCLKLFSSVLHQFAERNGGDLLPLFKTPRFK